MWPMPEACADDGQGSIRGYIEKSMFQELLRSVKQKQRKMGRKSRPAKLFGLHSTVRPMYC